MTIPTSTRIGEIQNAHLADGLTVRVGIPTPSGKLAFNAFNEGYATMVSAHSFWNVKTKRFRVPSASDLFETDFALDSAGFTSVHLWRQKGNQQGMAGIYPWSAAAYLELAAQLNPSWYSAPDFCCEPEISSDDLVVDRHIDATATMLELCLRILYEWENELVSTCSPDVVRMMIKPPVPVIQGYRHE